MTPDVAKNVVAVLYTAAGRVAEDPEHAIWIAGLATVPDEGASAIVESIVANVDLGRRTPTPALYVEHRRAWLRGQHPQRAIDPPVPADGAEKVRDLRRVLAGAKARATERKP